jgi:zinc transporter ZupT
LDGIALGAGLILPQLGPVVLLAVIVHEMPDSMSISSILLAAGWNRRKVAILNLLFSLTTPIGAPCSPFYFSARLRRKMSPSPSAFLQGLFWPSPRPISCRKYIALNSGIRQRWFFC